MPSKQSRRLAIFRRLLGVFLLIASVLKLAGMGFGIVPEVRWLSAPRLQLAAGEWELLLGVWLLSGVSWAGAWSASVLTFTAFACISGGLGLAGVADCGCFGLIKTSPWATFALDVGVLLGLAVARPDAKTTRGWARRLIAPATLAAATAGVLCLLALVAVLRYGSLGRAVGELRGEWLTAPEYIDFGTCLPNQAREKSVALRNLADHPVRLIGGTSDCSCLTTEGMPTEIPAGGEGLVIVTLSLPSSASGAFTRGVEIWVDDAGIQRSVRFRVGCRVDSSTLVK